MSARGRVERAKKCMREAEPYLSRHRNESHQFVPTGSALLVIDMQGQFLRRSSPSYLPDGEEIVDNVAALIAGFRQSPLPVVFTRHALAKKEPSGAMGRWWRDTIRDGDPMADIVPRLQPLAGEKVIRKSRYSAFVGTSLDRTLRKDNVSRLVVTGVMTHLCCDTTTRDAFMRGYDVFFVVDGTASRNEDLHMSSIKALADGFAIPVTTKEVLRWLRG